MVDVAKVEAALKADAKVVAVKVESVWEKVAVWVAQNPKRTLAVLAVVIAAVVYLHW